MKEILVGHFILTLSNSEMGVYVSKNYLLSAVTGIVQMCKQYEKAMF